MRSFSDDSSGSKIASKVGMERPKCTLICSCAILQMFGDSDESIGPKCAIRAGFAHIVDYDQLVLIAEKLAQFHFAVRPIGELILLHLLLRKRAAKLCEAFVLLHYLCLKLIYFRLRGGFGNYL